MTNSYGMVNQPQQNYLNYSMMQQPNQGSGIGVFGAATLGFLGGGTIGYFKHRRPVKDGAVTDTFAAKAFDRYVNKGLEQPKKDFFNQAKNILKKIDGIDSPEKLKSLLKGNKAVSDYAFKNGFSVDEFCNVLTSSNLGASKDNLTKFVKSLYDKEKEVMRNAISACWDADKKKLVKSPEVNDKAFKAIKDTASKMKWNKALKYGGIGAAIFGGAVLAYKSVVALLTKQAQKRQMEAIQSTYMNQQLPQNVQQQPNMQQQSVQMPQQAMIA